MSDRVKLDDGGFFGFGLNKIGLFYLQKFQNSNYILFSQQDLEIQ